MFTRGKNSNKKIVGARVRDGNCTIFDFMSRSTIRGENDAIKIAISVFHRDI